jgi:ABC-type amino acid transport substrate-binding protein
VALGARVLVVAGDIFVAADLDLAIDEADGVTAALAVSDREALMLLSQKAIDAAVVSPPLQEGDVGTVVDALVRQSLPFVIYEGRDDRIAEEIRDALEGARRLH